MEPEITNRLDAQDEQLSAIYQSVEKTRKYFLITMWVTLAAVVLPMLALLFIIPAVISSYASNLEGLL